MIHTCSPSSLDSVSMYLVTVLGNLLIIVVISNGQHLHSPMYFFLSNLSLSDICFTSTTVPKMILDILTHSRDIYYVSCLTQMSLYIVSESMDDLLLTVMAYDCFVAICHPLRYNAIMNPKLCWQLVLLSFLISVLVALLHTSMALRLSFCTNLEIPHFFCELDHLLKLACSDIFINTFLMYFITDVFGIVPVSGIIFSYTQIVSSILKISSASGKYKAFSVCGSHIITISLFYGTSFRVYLSSTDAQSPRKSAITSVMYTVVTPMMNLFIYNLRNKDMLRALGKLICRITSFHLHIRCLYYWNKSKRNK
ncbi:Olfactory receptor 7G3 [Fukomys damarensis]|uniref:Olfactory receptor 7G3 n=1 Tax=Fukomys damarensis TaxID=885580 RepID=A0A091CNK4_FUKDA|nr:Olfactory receptor 7G3 [Fukomys damarensis]